MMPSLPRHCRSLIKSDDFAYYKRYFHIIPYWEVECVGKKNDWIKYEIASELGLLEKVKKYGWKSLNAKETGRIGGLVTKRKRMEKN